MTSVTIKDIAKAAGVGSATVDRVLNGRGNPNAKTVAAVEQAIAELGYRPNLAAAALRRGRRLRIGVVLPTLSVSFLESLANHIPSIDEEFEVRGVSVTLVSERVTDPLSYATLLLSLQGQYDGLLILAPADPAVHAAVQALERKGTRVATFVSDLPNSNRSFFSGPSNRDIGATAAQIVLPAVLRASDRVIVTKANTMQDDIEARHLGFCQVLSRAGLTTDRIVSLDYSEVGPQSEIENAFIEAGQGEDVSAIYLTGGTVRGLSLAARAALGAIPTIVATDLTSTSRDFLIDGTLDFVVASRSRTQLRDGVTGLIRCLTEINWRAQNFDTPICIFNRFNLPRKG